MSWLGVIAKLFQYSIRYQENEQSKIMAILSHFSHMRLFSLSVISVNLKAPNQFALK